MHDETVKLTDARICYFVRFSYVCCFWESGILC